MACARLVCLVDALSRDYRFSTGAHSCGLVRSKDACLSSRPGSFCLPCMYSPGLFWFLLVSLFFFFLSTFASLLASPFGPSLPKRTFLLFIYVSFSSSAHNFRYSPVFVFCSRNLSAIYFFCLLLSLKIFLYTLSFYFSIYYLSLFRDLMSLLIAQTP